MRLGCHSVDGNSAARPRILRILRDLSRSSGHDEFLPLENRQGAQSCLRKRAEHHEPRVSCSPSRRTRQAHQTHHRRQPDFHSPPTHTSKVTHRSPPKHHGLLHQQTRRLHSHRLPGVPSPAPPSTHPVFQQLTSSPQRDPRPLRLRPRQHPPNHLRIRPHPRPIPRAPCSEPHRRGARAS